MKSLDSINADMMGRRDGGPRALQKEYRKVKVINKNQQVMSARVSESGLNGYAVSSSNSEILCGVCLPKSPTADD